MTADEDREEQDRLQKWPRFIADAILTYWLAGSENEELREWWTTDEAADCALELADEVLGAIQEKLGYTLMNSTQRTQPPGDCRRCGLPVSTHDDELHCYTTGDEKFLG